MISVYITCRDNAEAKKIAKNLLDKKLVACANIFPIESVFEWEGKLVEENEAAMLCKAKDANFPAIEKEVKSMHSYDVPCIVAFEWKAASRDYAAWVDK